MQKCGRCSLEFCSPFNYRRHTQVHRRTFIANKEPLKNRELLAAFWDKLSLEEAKGTVSFDDVVLKDIRGSTVIEALARSFRLKEIRSLPQDYAKAGYNLLAILHAISSLRAISSKELFNVLDDASEKTFLCGGTAVVEKNVYVAEHRLCLQLQNVIAITSFLFEKQLTKAWEAEKDAEALRCHKLLVEEEEAAQRRQSKLSERKQRKKQRQKQKLREHLNECNGDINIKIDSVENIPASAQESALQTFSDSISDSQDLSLKYTEPESNEPLGNTEAQVEHINQEHFQVIKPKMVSSSGQRRLAFSRWHEVNLQRERNWFHARNNNVSQPKPVNKIDPFKNRGTANKVWIKKLEVNIDKEESLKSQLVHKDTCHPEEEKHSCEVMIESISVTVNKQQDKSGTKKFSVKTTDGKSCANQQVASTHLSPVSPRKLEVINKLDPSKDQAATNEVWIKKLKVNGDKKESLKPQLVQEDICHPEEEKGSCKVMIGSISITVKSSVNKQQDKSGNEKFSVKTANGQSVASRQVAFRHLSSVSRGVTKSMPLFGKENEFMESSPTMDKVQERIATDESSLHLQSTNNVKDDLLFPDETLQGNSPLSRAAAKEFLARRWKVAISSDHVVWKRIPHSTTH